LHVLIPKINLYHEGDSLVKVVFYRYQFPVLVAFAITINKFPGQSMNQVSLVLKGQVFAHGQLYVGLSRVKNVRDRFVTQVGLEEDVLNVVVKQIFRGNVGDDVFME
jgi:ATP-dependent exoDNAse (exonuclease V) alpha subunit